MALVARIMGVSLLAGSLGAGVGYVLFGGLSGAPADYFIPTFLLACVAAIVGAVAGVGREIVIALRPENQPASNT